MNMDESREAASGQENGERVAALVKHSFDVIALVDRDATVQYVSPSIKNVLGYSPEAFIGVNGFDQIHPDDLEEVRRLFAEVLAEPGKSTAIDARLRHRDGSWRWVESRLTNLLENPAVRALVSNFRDITDRKLVEQRLGEREEYWRVALESIGDGVIVTDAAGRVTFTNAVASSLCGWPTAEAFNRPLQEVFHIVNERTRTPVENPVEKVIAHGQIVGLANHTVLIARDGNETAIDDSAAPISNDVGQISGIVLVFRDVTERRRAEHLQQRLAAIVESSDDVIASKTLDGIITSWNKGAERVLGYRADEVVGRSVSMLIPPEQAEDTEAILSSIRRGERVDHYQTKRRRKDGTIIDVSLTVSPIRDSDGTVIGASKVGRDITNQKAWERELNESSRRKDEFLAMLAHELRNPIAVINGAAQLFGKLESESELVWAQEVIQRQIKHLSRMIDDLLDVSRITRGKITLRKEVLNLAPIVSSALENVRGLMEDRKHEVSVSLAAGELRLAADPVRLEQILINLLSNAAKYTLAGGHISVTAKREQSDIVITVQDSGVGITEDMLQRIFDLFAQGDRTVARSEGGLGIGLTIVQKLAELHGGSVAAKSAGPGQGSQFTVRLPALPESVVTPSSTRGTLPRIARGSSRVLVVDDNYDMAVGLSKLLKLLGHDVQMAADGPTAMDIALAFRPEIVLLDIGLPGMDGYEVIRRLRNDDCCRDSLFIAITGYGQEEDLRKSKEAGFDHHMVKPIDYHALMTVIAQAG